MKISDDIKSVWLIHTKGVLFIFIGISGGLLLFFQSPTIWTCFLLLVTTWSFCRFYYYLFYVLDRYLGRNQKYSGVLDALRYLLSTKSQMDIGAQAAATNSEPPKRDS